MVSRAENHTNRSVYITDTDRENRAFSSARDITKRVRRKYV